MKDRLRLIACVAVGALGMACSTGSAIGGSGSASPTAPSTLPGISTSSIRSPLGGQDGHGLELTPWVGDGGGIVNVTPNARSGEFVANTEDVVHVRGVAPNTLLYVRVAADVGLPGGQQADGVCQRANLGQFAPLALYPGGPPATIETTAAGTGTVHVTFGATNPAIADGSQLDLVFRVVDALPPATPTLDLRSDCFTIAIQ